MDKVTITKLTQYEKLINMDTTAWIAVFGLFSVLSFFMAYSHWARYTMLENSGRIPDILKHRGYIILWIITGGISFAVVIYLLFSL